MARLNVAVCSFAGLCGAGGERQGIRQLNFRKWNAVVLDVDILDMGATINVAYLTRERPSLMLQLHIICVESTLGKTITLFSWLFCFKGLLQRLREIYPEEPGCSIQL